MNQHYTLPSQSNIGGIAPDKEPQVNIWMGRLDSAIKTIDKITDELKARLTPITRSEPILKNKEEGVYLAIAPLAENIRSSVISLDKNIESLQELLRKLEI